LTWQLSRGDARAVTVRSDWPVDRIAEWAWGGSTGSGVRVCIVDSGVETDHPDVRPVAASFAVRPAGDGSLCVVADPGGDAYGHGTACAGIVRQVAPAAGIVSVRVVTGPGDAGDALLTGLRWAVDEGFDVVNVSVSTTKQAFAASLGDVADRAYFSRTMLVSSAADAVENLPWRFSSVISVGGHDEPDGSAHYYNPAPPVEFFAPGADLLVAWRDGTRIRCSGNSFATPYVSGLCALILSKHPDLTPFQVKHILYLTAQNVGHQ
jgi:subtilisin family serine protease